MKVLSQFAWLILAGAPVMGLAQCGEGPTVQMDERTAASHLLAKKDLVIPERMPEHFRIEKVTLVITVDREGSICDVQAKAGPQKLRESAVRTVKAHWRYRRFLVNWKPVVAQFPVTVKFLLPKEEPRQTAQGEGLQRQFIVARVA